MAGCDGRRPRVGPGTNPCGSLSRTRGRSGSQKEHEVEISGAAAAFLWSVPEIQPALLHGPVREWSRHLGRQYAQIYDQPGAPYFQTVARCVSLPAGLCSRLGAGLRVRGPDPISNIPSEGNCRRRLDGNLGSIAQIWTAGEPGSDQATSARSILDQPRIGRLFLGAGLQGHKWKSSEIEPHAPGLRPDRP